MLLAVVDAARIHTMEAVETLVTIMRDKDAPPAARVNASNGILDRGWGKPSQPLTGDADAPLQIAFRTVYEKAKGGN